MTIKRIKQLLNFGQNIIILSFSFCLLETLVFLVYEGWHWKATHPIEKILDKICSFGVTIGLMFMVLSVFAYVINQIEKE